MSLRIAAVQMEPVIGDVAANVVAMARWINRAADKKADLVIFPEAATTGYQSDQLARHSPNSADFQWLSGVVEATQRRGIVAIVNSALRKGEHLRLSDILIAPGQEPTEVYSKQHLYPLETGTFDAGARGASIVINDVEIALSVCYDANFAEHASSAAVDGAQVYLNSGAYFSGGGERRDLRHAARALDNGMYFIFSGLFGVPHDFIGGTAAFDPYGRRIAHVESGEGMFAIDVDPALVTRARADQRMLADRRENLGPRTRIGLHQ